MKTVHPLCTYVASDASNPLLHKHYRNRLPIHCSVELAIETAEKIAIHGFYKSELNDKALNNMAHVLLAFAQQRKDL